MRKNNNYKGQLALVATLALATCVNAQTQDQRSERAMDQDSTNIYPLTGPSGMTEIRSVQMLTTTSYRAPGQVRTAGTCGASANSILTSTPTSLLCSTGTPSGVTYANGSYGWTCTGTNGVAAQCSAVQRVVGACGSSNGASTSTAPTSLCSAGTATAAVLSGATYNWYCVGNYGSPAACSAALVPADPYASYPTTFRELCQDNCPSSIQGFYSSMYAAGYSPYNANPGGWLVPNGTGHVVGSSVYNPATGRSTSYTYDFDALQARGYKIFITGHIEGNGNNYIGRSYYFSICKNC